MNKKLYNTIMRRVYYAFCIRLVSHPAILYMLALVGVGWWLTKLVFVARIWQSFTATPVGELSSFMYGLVTGADTLTLAVTALFIWCAYRVLRWCPEWPRTTSVA